MDAGAQFSHIKRLGDEILGSGLQRAQLMTGLGGNDEHRKIVVAFNFLECFHHLEAIEYGHL